VLYWIHGSKKLPPFVSHSVTKIKQLIPSALWRYCPTKDNPADLLTQGITFEQFKSAVSWTHGPTWLLDQQHWPVWQHSCISHLHVVAAITDEFTHTEQEPSNVGLHYIIKVTNYSTLPRLLLVIGLQHLYTDLCLICITHMKHK